MTVTLESLKKSVGKKISKSEIFAWLADLERAAGDLDGALQRVNGGLILYPHDVAAMIVRAKILFQQEKYDECVQQCETILVKDPFSLAGQKIMGDAYDKLGMEPERNRCYRRFHDMDPLNDFWKEEYDVADVAAAAVGAAAADLNFSDEDFSMPDMAAPSPENVKTLEELEAENAAAMGEGSLELSAGDLFKDDGGPSVENSFEKAFGDTFGSMAEDDASSEGSDASFAEPAQEDGGLFEKSASSIGISLDDDVPNEAVASPFSMRASDEMQTGFASQNESTSEFGAAPFATDQSNQDSSEESLSFGAFAEEGAADDDPFAALAAMLPNSDAEEDSMMESLSEALDATMADIAQSSSEEKPVEEFPVDDNISVTDVNSAMSDFFGFEDDLEPEESTAAETAAENSMAEDSAMANASMIFGDSSSLSEAPADKPMSVDSAFNDIFGEDELPEEDKPTNVDDAFNDIFGEDELPEEDKPTSVDDAFNDIFGEDELPEELPVETPAEPVASDAFTFIEEPAADAAPQSSDEALSVDGAFNDIFGEDSLELPEESAAPVEESAVVDELAAPAEESVVVEESATPAAESSLSVDGAFSSIFGDDDDLPEEVAPAVEDSLELPAEESFELPAAEPESTEEPPAESAVVDEFAVPAEESVVAEESATPAAESSLSVDGAFSSIFGDDDDLPEETAPAVEDSLELPAEETSQTNENSFSVDSAFDSLFGNDETPAEENTFVSEVETPVEPAVTSAMDFVLDDEPVASEELVVEENVESVEKSTVAEDTPQANDNGFSVDSAFDSLFGDDDDLPVENAEEVPAVPAADDDNTLAEQVDLAESELELPSTVKQESSDLAQEMGGAFASMFGDQDDLDIPDLAAPASDDVTENVADQQATGAAFEEAASEKLESDLDKSFSELFGGDDDLNLNSDTTDSIFGQIQDQPADDLALDSLNVASETSAVSGVDSLESEVSGAFKGLFDMDDDSLSINEDKPSNSGVDFLMSGDSDDEVSAGLINNPEAPLNRGVQDLDESLNTRTLAEIYFDQGLYGKALEIYSDLAQKEPENQEIAMRCAEIEKIYRDKFGGNG